MQQQLDISYHDDRFLRDRLLTAVDTPTVKAALRDHMPRNSQQAINRIAVQLSDRKKSAAVAAACLVQGLNEVFYSLDKSYHGEARRQTMKPYKHSGRKTYGGNSQGGNGRRINSNWMRGVKGCFVCGKDHRANKKHPRDEFTLAINRLKAKHPSALLTIEDMHSVIMMAQTDDENDGSNEDDDANAMWLESDDDDEKSDLAYICTHGLKDVQMSLANNAFIHGHYSFTLTDSPSINVTGLPSTSFN